MSRFGDRSQGVRAKSGPTDLVSEPTWPPRRRSAACWPTRRPGDAILGEEGGASGDGELRWIVDPLDGTINFLFGIPAFAVSVACEDAAGALVGVVLDPVRGERFAATRSGPRDARTASRSTGSTRDELSTALVATGFGYDAGVRARQAAGGHAAAAPRARHPPRRRGRARPVLGGVRAL